MKKDNEFELKYAEALKECVDLIEPDRDCIRIVFSNAESTWRMGIYLPALRISLLHRRAG